jgi:hypothetical protein
VRVQRLSPIMKYSPEGILMVPEKLQIAAARQGAATARYASLLRFVCFVCGAGRVR